MVEKRREQARESRWDWHNPYPDSRRCADCGLLYRVSYSKLIADKGGWPEWLVALSGPASRFWPWRFDGLRSRDTLKDARPRQCPFCVTHSEAQLFELQHAQHLRARWRRRTGRRLATTGFVLALIFGLLLVFLMV